MKKILLLSDTHGYMGEDILKHIRSCDEVWHAGDIGDLTVTDAIKKLNRCAQFMAILMEPRREVNFRCIKNLRLRGLRFGSPTLEVTPTVILKTLEKRLKMSVQICLSVDTRIF